LLIIVRKNKNVNPFNKLYSIFMRLYMVFYKWN
jgi:hypothetical protein